LLGQGFFAGFTPAYELTVSRAVRTLACGALAWNRPSALLTLAGAPAHRGATLLGNARLRHLTYHNNDGTETYTGHLAWLRGRAWRADSGPLAVDSNLDIVFAEADLVDGCLVTRDGGQAHSVAVARNDRQADERLASRLKDPSQVDALAALIGTDPDDAVQQYANAYTRMTPGDGWPRPPRTLFDD
jgi:hypothetical protein